MPFEKGHHIGRRTILKPQLCRVIYRALISGNSRSNACRLAKISRNTFDKWLRDGEKHDAECILELHDCLAEKHALVATRIFSLNIKRCEGLDSDYRVRQIRRAPPQQWAAHMTHLERRHPEEWSKPETRHHVEVSGGTSNTHKMVLENATPQQKLKMGLALQQQAQFLLGQGKPIIDVDPIEKDSDSELPLSESQEEPND